MIALSYFLQGYYDACIASMQDALGQLGPGDPIEPLAFGSGWSPDGKVLILSTGWQNQVNSGPFEISAAVVTADGHATTTVLTRTAVTFPFIGFVRTG